MSFAGDALRAIRSSGAKTMLRPSLTLAMGETRSYSIAGAATVGAAAAGSGAAFRILGYNIPWPAIVGVSLTAVFGVYAWETKKISDIDRQPLEVEVMKTPTLPEGARLMSQSGKKIDVAATIRGKHALLAFGSLHSTDQPILEHMGKAAESAKQRTGWEVVPVYISLDPIHDKPEDLKTAAGRSGSPSMLVVSGPPDGLLGAAERFKNSQIARRNAALKGSTELMKKPGLAVETTGYISDNLYVIDQGGRVVGMMPKNRKVEDLAACLTEEVQKTGLKMVP